MARFSALFFRLCTNVRVVFSSCAEGKPLHRSWKYYHLTQRCQHRTFLLRLARDRNGYRARLREAVLETRLTWLTSNITSNHAHLVTYADHADQVAAFKNLAVEPAVDLSNATEKLGSQVRIGKGFSWRLGALCCSTPLLAAQPEIFTTKGAKTRRRQGSRPLS